MTSEAEVKTALVRWVKITVPAAEEVILGQQSGPRPKQPYIMLNFLHLRAVREHEQRIEWEEEVKDPLLPRGRLIATPVIETEWFFSFHSYGDNPTDLLRPIRSAVKVAQAQEPLLPKLVIHNVSHIRSIPDWDGTEWEERAQMDVSVRGLVRDGHLVDGIEQAKILFNKTL